MSSCSICSESTNLSPLALQEMEILTKFVLSQEQIALILQTENPPPILCCQICSSTILSLAETQIENIASSLRAVISSRNGLFNKVRNESKISELPHLVAADNDSPADKISKNDDDQHLSECLEEEGEEIIVKVEPTYYYDDDDEVMSDPLNMPQNDDDNNSHHVANSGVKIPPNLVCTICQPNVTFTRYDVFMSRLRSNKIHPHLSEADIAALKKFVCKECGVMFTLNKGLLRHMRIHPDISAAEISAMRMRNRPINSKFGVGAPSKYVCKICQPSVTFHRSDTYKRHMRNKNIHPNLSEEDISGGLYNS
ncbi:uncharacterized protein LOC110861613 [Folsomia candida]|uniref:Zinc finger and BTB domain-containing protein 7A n=1 Tax=Folsomia candida TaxID=158441 RepID=A0A226D3N8_FOLCA|nr:uncharacterized protein LOC110861613 [Folsomia candida]OXA38866.1 Zinc finger and BTB domain-containing protein 7A [Folsomia candida]